MKMLLYSIIFIHSFTKVSQPHSFTSPLATALVRNQKITNILFVWSVWGEILYWYLKFYPKTLLVKYGSLEMDNLSRCADWGKLLWKALKTNKSFFVKGASIPSAHKCRSGRSSSDVQQIFCAAAFYHQPSIHKQCIMHLETVQEYCTACSEHVIKFW